jgi:hypothetical protein
MGDRSVAYKALIGRPEKKRPLRRPRGRWKDIIKQISKKWYGEAWI